MLDLQRFKIIKLYFASKDENGKKKNKKTKKRKDKSFKKNK